MVEVVSEDDPVDAVLDVGHLEPEHLLEVSIRRLSELSQVWLVLYEVHQAGESHETFVQVTAALPALDTREYRDILDK